MLTYNSFCELRQYCHKHTTNVVTLAIIRKSPLFRNTRGYSVNTYYEFIRRLTLIWLK
jgi:hypothetical protein